jgi:hypothetical protein
MSVVNVTQIALRKSKHGVNCVVSNVDKHGRFRNLLYQCVKGVRYSILLLTVEPPSVQRAIELRRNPHNNVVRVGINSNHGEALRLRLEPIFKLTRVTTLVVTGINCIMTLRLSESCGKAIKVGGRAGTPMRKSVGVSPHIQLIWPLINIHKEPMSIVQNRG